MSENSLSCPLLGFLSGSTVLINNNKQKLTHTDIYFILWESQNILETLSKSPTTFSSGTWILDLLQESLFTSSLQNVICIYKVRHIIWCSAVDRSCIPGIDFPFQWKFPQIWDMAVYGDLFSWFQEVNGFFCSPIFIYSLSSLSFKNPRNMVWSKVPGQSSKFQDEMSDLGIGIF